MSLTVTRPRAQTCLTRASYSGSLECVEILIANGVDLNARTETGWNSLGLAAHANHLAIVQRLLAAGANVDQLIAPGQNALTTALGRNNHEVARLLFQAKATFLSKSAEPLLLEAAKEGRAEVVRVLM